MSGFVIDVALRMRLLRFDLSYGHMRGNLFDGSGYEYTPTQGSDSIGVGIAIQGGWHHLVSPYLGLRFRSDLKDGEFVDTFTEQTMVTPYGYTHDRHVDALTAGRVLGTLGLQVSLPGSRGVVMERAFHLGVEVYRSLDGSDIDSGLMLTLARSIRLPSSIGALPELGATGLRASERKWAALMMPYVMWGGGGLTLYSSEDGYKALSGIDFWMRPGATGFENFGLSLFSVGVKIPLPNGPHALTLKGSPVSLQRYTTDEDAGTPSQPLGKLTKYGFGQATIAYRRFVLGNVVEAGIKLPIFWVANRKYNSIDPDGPSGGTTYFDGAPPINAYVGIGY
jgi:hypothetical protein